MLCLAQRHVNGIEELILRHQVDWLFVIDTLDDLNLKRLEGQNDVVL